MIATAASTPSSRRLLGSLGWLAVSLPLALLVLVNLLPLVWGALTSLKGEEGAGGKAEKGKADEDIPFPVDI